MEYHQEKSNGCITFMIFKIWYSQTAQNSQNIQAKNWAILIFDMLIDKEYYSFFLNSYFT